MENEDMTPPRFRQGDCLYCRYEGENRQKHFEAGHERREMGESKKECQEGKEVRNVPRAEPHGQSVRFV